MSELMFVLKSLAITAVITVAMQVRVGNSSLEQQSQWFLQRSPVSIYVQSVAAGGAMALRNLYANVRGYNHGSSVQAGR